MRDSLRQRWNLDALQHTLALLQPGLAVEIAASLESTNSALLERARAGLAAPCLLVTESQTKGRGRQGKAWQSAAGASLTFSLSLPLSASDWSGLSLAVGLALAEALDAPHSSQPTGGAPRLMLKWPNDLMLYPPPGQWPEQTPEQSPKQSPGGHDVLPRKLGGILIESLPLAGQRIAVIGVGLNIAPRPDAASDHVLSQGYAWLQELQPGVTAAQALAQLASPLLAMLKAFERHGFAALRDRYAARDALLGQRLTTTLPDLPEGVADGVANDGALWLRAAGRRHRLISGEVSVRAAGAAWAGEPSQATAKVQPTC